MPGPTRASSLGPHLAVRKARNTRSAQRFRWRRRAGTALALRSVPAAAHIRQGRSHMKTLTLGLTLVFGIVLGIGMTAVVNAVHPPVKVDALYKTDLVTADG